MQNAEQIAEIAQSEHVWNLYVRSGLFPHRISSGKILDEARGILRNKLELSASCLTGCERTKKALERLNVSGPFFVLQ